MINRDECRIGGGGGGDAVDSKLRDGQAEETEDTSQKPAVVCRREKAIRETGRELLNAITSEALSSASPVSYIVRRMPRLATYYMSDQ